MKNRNNKKVKQAEFQKPKRNSEYHRRKRRMEEEMVDEEYYDQMQNYDPRWFKK